MFAVQGAGREKKNRTQRAVAHVDSNKLERVPLLHIQQGVVCNGRQVFECLRMEVLAPTRFWLHVLFAVCMRLPAGVC